MDLGALFLLALVLIFIILFVTRPFLDRRRTQAGKKNLKLTSLLADRVRLLTAIEELDSDQALEKIPPEEYPRQRADLLHQGSEVLRQIDALTSITSKKMIDETAIHPDDSVPFIAALTDDELEDMLAKRRSIRKEKTAGFCPKCGKPVLSMDVFCPSCGHALK
jgi:hypothetical protein